MYSAEEGGLSFGGTVQADSRVLCLFDRAESDPGKRLRSIGETFAFCYPAISNPSRPFFVLHVPLE